jgi:hypothetical protein
MMCGPDAKKESEAYHKNEEKRCLVTRRLYLDTHQC